jgi:hypothetical protein
MFRPETAIKRAGCIAGRSRRDDRPCHLARFERVAQIRRGGIEVRFIQEFGYTVKSGREEAHQRWLVENEEKLAKAHPKGTRYLGTFATIFTTDKQSGGYRTFVELDSYAAMDRLAAAGKDGSTDYGKLNREWSGFGDYDLNAPWSKGLHKAVVDATLWDPPAG